MNEDNPMRQVVVASQMLDMRALARRVLSAEAYDRSVATWQAAIAKVAADEFKGDALKAVIEIGKRIDAAGDDSAQLWLIAAYVEMVHPTPPAGITDGESNGGR